MTVYQFIYATETDRESCEIIQGQVHEVNLSRPLTIVYGRLSINGKVMENNVNVNVHLKDIKGYFFSPDGFFFFIFMRQHANNNNERPNIIILSEWRMMMLVLHPVQSAS